MFYEMVKPEISKVEEYIAKTIETQPPAVYGMLLPYIMRGGKRLRPLLAILSCKAVGGDASKVIRPAGILEMFHNFSLIHDDLVDNSQFRRGEPTLHITHGIPIALNSGDALYTLVWSEMMDLGIGQKRQIELQKMYVEVFKKVVEGQGTELDWEINNRFDINEKEYLEMIDGKTSSLIGFSCCLGAYMGGADERLCKRFARFGMKIGAAFQIHDDVLNVTGSFEKYKKEIGGDITEGKRTLMVVHSLRNCQPKEAEELKRILKTHSREKGDIDYVINMFKKYRSIEYARDTAMRLIGEAEAELEKLSDSKEKQALISLCDYIVSRES